MIELDGHLSGDDSGDEYADAERPPAPAHDIKSCAHRMRKLKPLPDQSKSSDLRTVSTHVAAEVTRRNSKTHG